MTSPSTSLASSNSLMEDSWVIVLLLDITNKSSPLKMKTEPVFATTPSFMRLVLINKLLLEYHEKKNTPTSALIKYTPKQLTERQKQVAV